MILTNKEFDQEKFYEQLNKMYETRSIDPITPYCSHLQQQVFQTELDTLAKYNLRKELNIKLSKYPSEQIETASNKSVDGKVDSSFTLTKAKTKETYYDYKNKKRHERKTANAFLETILTKTNLVLTYPHQQDYICQNCGAVVEKQADRYYCAYCSTEYKSEASAYLVSRFRIVNSMKGLGFLGFFLIPIVLFSLLLIFEIVPADSFESLVKIFSYGLASILLIALIIGAVPELYKFIRHNRILKNIKRKDPRFSKTLLSLRVLDLLQLEPELFSSSDKKEALISQALGFLIRDHNLNQTTEKLILECGIDGLKIKGSINRPKLIEGIYKYKVQLYRAADTVTKAYYEPEQYTCSSCGSHETIRHAKWQICSYCNNKQSMDTIDWVIEKVEPI